MRRSVSLLIVAPYAGTYEVLPYVRTATSARNDMIDGQRDIRTAAILAAVPVAAKDVFSREDDFLEGNPDVDGEADNAGKRHRSGHRMEKLAVNGGNQLSFPKIQENDRLFDVTNTERLVVVV